MVIGGLLACVCIDGLGEEEGGFLLEVGGELQLACDGGGEACGEEVDDVLAEVRCLVREVCLCGEEV